MSRKSKKKRKGTVARFPNGKLRPEYRRSETPQQATAVVRAQRARRVGEANAHRPEAGYELGILFILGHLGKNADSLHDAGCRYARIVSTWQRIMGYPYPHPAAMDIDAAKGLSLSETPDPEDIERATNDYMRLQTVLADAGSKAMGEVREVCVFDRPARDIAALLTGLEAVANFFQLPLDKSQAA